MKFMKLTCYLSLTALLIASLSCSKEEPSGGKFAKGEAPIIFNVSGISSLQQTRATPDNTWESGLLVGVKIGSDVRVYTVVPDAADTKKATLVNAKERNDPFYWESDTQEIEVTSWAPYKDGDAQAPTNIEVQLDQSKEENYNASDYITTDATIISYAAPDISFKHITAKVTINLKCEDSSVDLTDAVVKLINLKNGVIDENNNTLVEIICYDCSTNGNYTYSALIAPQTQTDTKLVYIKLKNGVELVCSTEAADLEFKAGSNHIIDVTVVNTTTSISTDIMPWEDFGSHTIDYPEGIILSAEGEYGYIIASGGTQRTYYVGTEKGLRAWADYVSLGNYNANCILTNDVILTTNADGSPNWTPVASSGSGYEGTFSGNDFTIYNLVSSGSGTQVLVAALNGGSVTNVNYGTLDNQN